MMSLEKTSDFYNEAIKELEAVSADFETDDSVQREANKQITFLRTKSQEAGLDDIVGRNGKLKVLMNALMVVTDKAQGSSMTKKISNVVSLQKKVQSMIGEPGNVV